VNLPVGVFIASTALSFPGGNKMPVSTDEELQARLLKAIYELSAKKQKLEDDIRKLEAVNKSLQETAALREIEAYKNQQRLSPKLSSR
jgi:division protein CdvB (Snf7/Vps24/ESCRT-III family)